MGKDVKYFGIGEFKGVGLGSTYDWEHAMHGHVLGPCPLGDGITPIPNILLLQRDCKRKR